VAAPPVRIVPVVFQKEGDFLPARAVESLHRAMMQAGSAVISVGRAVVGQATPDKAPAPPGPRSVDVNLKMDRVDLAAFVEGLGLKLPFPVSGRLSFQVQASVPLDTSGDPKTYRVKGTATLTQLRLLGAELEQVQARVTYTNGVLLLQDLIGRVPDVSPPDAGPAPVGTFQGTARLQLVPLGELTAGLTLDRIPLTRLSDRLAEAVKKLGPGFATPFVSGSVKVQAPADRLRDVDAWQATGIVTVPQARALGWTLRDVAADLRLKGGTVSLTDARFTLEGTPATGSVELRLAEPFGYSGQVELSGWDLAALGRLAPDWRPPVPVEGGLDAKVGFRGTLNPLSFRPSGTATAKGLKVDNVKVKDLAFTWESDDQRLTVKDAHASLYGGTVKGTAVVPLTPTAAGNLDVRVEEVDVGELAKDLALVPVRLEGKAGGTLKGTFAAAGPGQERPLSVALDLQATRLRVQNIPAERLQGTIGYRKGVVEFNLKGEALGGRFRLEGRHAPTAAKPAEPPRDGLLELEGAQLERLWEALGVRGPLAQLGGAVNLEVRFGWEGLDRVPTGSGRVVLNRLRLGDTELAGSVRGDVQVSPREVRLREVTGSLANGLVRGGVSLNLENQERSWFNLTLERVEATRLLKLLWPDVDLDIQGEVDAHLRATLGREWHGTGQVMLLRGKVLGVEVSEWRLPFSGTFTPGRGYGRAEIRDSEAQVAYGRATGEATLNWGAGGLGLAGYLRFTNVDLRTLLRQLGDVGQVGNGRVTGRLDFAGQNMRSLDDLTATLKATLSQTQALEFPVLRQLTPFLRLSSPASTYNSGDLEARLARGVVRIQRLSLDGRLSQLWVEGTVTLQGRLDLDVTANTGPSTLAPHLCRFLGLRGPLNGPVPVRLLTQANAFLTKRLLRLRVTGTVRSPVVRVEPLSLLTEEALRFFVTRALSVVP
jgi:translocation and assembly module TamB